MIPITLVLLILVIIFIIKLIKELKKSNAELIEFDKILIGQIDFINKTYKSYIDLEKKLKTN